MEFSKVQYERKKLFLSVLSLLSDIISNITDPFHKVKLRGASRAKLTQGAAHKRNGTSLSYAKKLLLRNCYPLRLALLP